MEKKRSWNNLRYYPGICLKGIRNATTVSRSGFELRTSQTQHTIFTTDLSSSYYITSNERIITECHSLKGRGKKRS